MKFLYFIIAVFVSNFNCFTQSVSSTDSLSIYLQKADSTYNALDYNASLEYGEKALQIAKNKRDFNDINLAKIKIANAYLKLRLFDYALKTLDEITLSKQPSKKELFNFITALNSKGNIYYSKYEDDLAIAHYIKADSISNVYHYINDSQIKALQNIGLMLLRGYDSPKKSNYGRAKDYFKMAYDNAKSINSLIEMHFSGLYYGSTFVETENPNPEIALKYYSEAKIYFEENNHIKELNDTYWAFASLYKKIGRNDLAETYYLENISKNKTYKNNTNLGKAYWAYACFLRDIDNKEKAINAFQNSIETLKKEKNTDLGVITDCLYSLSQLYNLKGENELAYQNLNDYIIYKDSLDDRKDKIAFNELETKYQSEKKEQEIALLKAENAIKETQKYIYISLLALLLVGFVAIYLMYRNKLKTAQKIKELNELKSRFFANISHEFRTPLTLIKSPVQTLRTKADASQQPQLDMIESNSNRMLELVDQLLELSKIDSGNLKLILKQGNLSSFLKSIVEPFAYKSETSQKPLQIDIQETASNILFDKDVIEKIVSNLLSNALKYGDTNEVIHFESQIIDGHLLLVVRNTNSDLKHHDLPKLFERFYQTNTSNDGAGIGLALVKELVQLYEGTIDVQLNNQQLAFAVKLPLHSNLKHAIVTSTQNDVEIKSLEIEEHNNDLPIVLVVDDHPEIRNVIASIFEPDFKVLQSKNGKDALTLAQKEIPDVIISDIMMPEMDGFEFCKQIKSNELTSFIPIILLTAKTSEATHLEALQSTADAFLTKPFNHEVLKATVTQQLQERKKLQAHYSQELILKPTEVLINSVDEKFINRLQDVFQQEFTNPDFNTELFASKMTMSRMQLHRKLKSLFGISATEFVRNERLKTAADLMKNKQLSISEIAYGVGFNDLYYFSKCFKDLYKVAPSEYQKSL